MLLIVSLIFLIAVFVVPTHAVLIGPWAKSLPWLPSDLWIAAIDFGLYGILVLAAVIAQRMYRTNAIAENREVIQWLSEAISFRGWQWMGWAAIFGIGVAIVAAWCQGVGTIPGTIAAAAGILGLWDSVLPTPLLKLSGFLPTERFELDSASNIPEAEGRAVDFRWERWSQEGTPLEARFVLRGEEYEAAAAIPRFPRQAASYPRYATEKFGDSMRAVARWFRDWSVTEGLGDIDEMENVVCFARAIAYSNDADTHPDSPDGDYTDFPIELLWEGRGDCEDHAILAAAILYHLGHPVGLFFLDLGSSGHVALGYADPEAAGAFGADGKNGVRYQYVETVPGDTPPGEIPDEFLERLHSTEVVPVGEPHLA